MLLYNGDCTDEVKRNFNGKVVDQYRYTFTRDGEEVEVVPVGMQVLVICKDKLKGFIDPKLLKDLALIS